MSEPKDLGRVTRPHLQMGCERPQSTVLTPNHPNRAGAPHPLPLSHAFAFHSFSYPGSTVVQAREMENSGNKQ